jgi:hypothetical protein
MDDVKTAAGAAGEPNAEPRDSFERTAAALEQFTAGDKTEDGKQTDAPAAAAASGDAAKPGDAKPGDAASKPADAKPADAGKPGDGAADDISKAPFFNDPAFQKYHTAAQADKAVVTEFRQIFDAGRYAIKDGETLKNVHEDAFLLYDIAAGKAKASDLLELFKKNWPEDQFKAVVQELANYAAGMKIAGKELDPNSPEGRIAKLEADRAADQKARDEAEKTTKTKAEAAELEKTRMKTVDALFEETKRWLGEKGIAVDPKADAAAQKEAQAEIDDYALFISGELGKNPDLVKQLEKGQFGEAQRLLQERYNALVTRAKRYSDDAIKRFQDRNRNVPKVPTREGTAAGEATKRNLTDGDTRRKIALEQFTGKPS